MHLWRAPDSSASVTSMRRETNQRCQIDEWRTDVWLRRDCVEQLEDME